MNRPFFSISTPCWNSASTIERTLQSVLSQSCIDYEYIIVDGGSTDGTLDIIKRFEPLFEGRMHWRSERDKGLYDAFNKGVVRSNGIYCWNLNADDYMEPEVLSKIKEFVLTHHWDHLPILFGNLKFVSLDGTLISIFEGHPEKLEHAYRNDYIGVPHPATLVPKEVYERIGAFDPFYKIIGDADWFHRAYGAGEKFEYIDVALSNMSDGGISNQFNYRRSLRDRKYYLKKHYTNSLVRFWHWAQWTVLFYRNKMRASLKR